MACELWLLVFTLFGVHWVMPQPQDVMDLFAFWKGGLIIMKRLDLKGRGYLSFLFEYLLPILKKIKIHNICLFGKY